MGKIFETKKKIIELIKSKPLTMTQLSEKLDLGPSTVNQHIKELLDIGAIRETDNPYSRKWKYYEYNKGFDKKLEDQGYNMAKVRTFAVLAIVIAAAIGLIAILYYNNGLPQNPVTTQPPSKAGFVVQLTDPPLVPPGTNALVISYSSIGVLYRNSSAYEYFNASGSANLMSLTNFSQTLAVISITNYSAISRVRLNISSAYITIGNSTYNVTLPLNHISAGVNSTGNSSIGGVLLNLDPTIVRIYSQNNQSIFVMVPNVKAIFVGKADVTNAAVVGHVESTSPEIRHMLQSSSRIKITNATLTSEGNTTSIAVSIMNTGNSTVNLTSLQVEGFMEEIRLGYQGYPLNVSAGAAGEIKACPTSGICTGTTATGAISINGGTSTQDQLEAYNARNFVDKFNNFLNFIVLQNGTLELPVLDYAGACPEKEGIMQFIGCAPRPGYVLSAGSTATLRFSSTIKISHPSPSPEAQGAAAVAVRAPIFAGDITILLIPNQTYEIRVIGTGQNDTGPADATFNATDHGNITGSISKLVGVSYVSEHVLIGSLSLNYTLQGFTSALNGITNYTMPIVSLGEQSTIYSLQNVSILTPGFLLLGTTNVTLGLPERCPVCTGESSRCMMSLCIGPINRKAVVLRIESPGYQYYGPLSIKAEYSATPPAANNTTTVNTTTTIPSGNRSGFGTVDGKVNVGPLCPVENFNGTCTSSVVNTSTLYSTLKIELMRISATTATNNYTISLNANGSFSQQVSAGTYSLSMLNCNYIGCSNVLPKTLDVSAGETTTLDIGINTGIA